jgi:ATP-dependent Clp protease protease subunit
MQEEFKKFSRSRLGIPSTLIEDYSRYLTSSIYNLTPYILEERRLNVTQMDVFSRLMMDRIIFLGYPINDEVANIVVAQLLFLESTDPARDVFIYINCPGGGVYAGLAIYDVMQYVAPDVATVCTGMAASMGAVLLAAGTKGKRSALPHSRVMIHQPIGGIGGQASDVQIIAEQILKIKKELYEVLSLHTGKEVEQIERDADRDYWMRADEALAYGLIDEVLPKNKLIKKKDE